MAAMIDFLGVSSTQMQLSTELEITGDYSKLFFFAERSTCVFTARADCGQHPNGSSRAVAHGHLKTILEPLINLKLCCGYYYLRFLILVPGLAAKVAANCKVF